VVGCAVFVSGDVLGTIGLLDSSLFLNGEDIDWCLRARKYGLKNYTVVDARIWHKVAASFGGGTPLWRYFMTRNDLVWAKRYLPASQYRAVLLKSITEILPAMDFLALDRALTLKDRYWRLIAWFRLIRSSNGKGDMKARFYGNLHYFQKRFGDCPARLRDELLTLSQRT
jgi:GT2 family glycosyltransferase